MYKNSKWEKFIIRILTDQSNNITPLMSNSYIDITLEFNSIVICDISKLLK